MFFYTLSHENIISLKFIFKIKKIHEHAVLHTDLTVLWKGTAATVDVAAAADANAAAAKR